MPLLNRAFPPSATITIRLVSLAVMAAMIWLMPRVLKDKRAAGSEGVAALTPRVERPSYFRNLQQGLRIEIDEGKRQKQVDEIVETDFFQDLQAKARAIRTRTPCARPDAPAGVAAVSQP